MFLELIWYSTRNNFNCKIIQFNLVAQMIKNLSAIREIWIQSWVREIPLKNEMVTDPIILAWRMPWTEKPGGL